jgi:tripartite ATP-independent transporter DctM subunit
MEWWAFLIIMFGGFVVLMATGLPVAFSFGILNITLLFVLTGGEAGLQIAAISAFGSIATFAFIAVPLFVLMGEVVLHAGLANLAIAAIGKWMGKFPGRLAVIAVMAGTIFAAASGSSMASAATIGAMLIPEMRNQGYDKGLIVGSLATAGALAILIPPSALMVIYGGISQISVGALLIGGILPGILISCLLITYIMGICSLRPHMAPVHEIEKVTWAERLVSLRHFVPLAVLILSVVGSIFAGIATPSEAAGMGAFASFVLAAVYRRLNLEMLRKALLGTVHVTGFSLLIITSSTAFSQILAYTGAAAGLSEFATGLPISPMLIVIGMQLVILFMGGFMEPVSIMLITIPVFLPVARALGFDLLWFAIVSMVNIELSMITPPFGLNLFILKGVCPPDITLFDIYKGALPFVVINIIALALVIIFPALATFLPSLL